MQNARERAMRSVLRFSTAMHVLSKILQNLRI